MFNLLRRFSKIIPIEEKSPSSLLGADCAESIEEYSKAMDLILQKQWPEAELELQKCSEILEKSDQSGEPSHNFVIQRLALAQRAQGKLSQCEESLEKVVFNYRQNETKYQDQLEFSYQTLYKQYLSSNISKAVRLGDILQSSQIWGGLKKETQKNIKFYYAVITIKTALTLQGKDYFKAKSAFYDCLKLNPEGNSCFVYHNLGTTQWLHLRDLSSENFRSLPSEAQDEYKRVTLDFTESVANLQKAIQLFEGFPDLYTLESGLGFKNKLTGLSLVNVGEIYLEQMEPEVKLNRKPWTGSRSRSSFMRTWIRAAWGGLCT